MITAAAPLPISLAASCYYAVALCYLLQLAPIGSGPNAPVMWYAAALVIQVGLAVVTLSLALLVARRRSRVAWVMLMTLAVIHLVARRELILSPTTWYPTAMPARVAWPLYVTTMRLLLETVASALLALPPAVSWIWQGQR
ncbi:hypothetical protein [Sphingomonas sp. BK235]|uniref:hypothetical protein n=1 Tax=Sphingomonas sp. BK235 TaxID=2512131 RepID=UPI0010472021|nr:hypothetical protein [Sphingomonas sp. BK235]